MVFLRPMARSGSTVDRGAGPAGPGHAGCVAWEHNGWMPDGSRSAAAGRRMAEAHRRAAKASLRVQQLRQLGRRLESGEAITGDDLGWARGAALAAVQDAEVARARDLDEHLASALAHRRAAAWLLQHGRLEKAREHLSAAKMDEDAAHAIAEPSSGPTEPPTGPDGDEAAQPGHDLAST